MHRSTIDNYSNATATYATYATRVARVARVQVATPIKTDITASDEPVSHWWQITFDGLPPVILEINPPCTKQQIILLNQGATLYEPILEPFKMEVIPND